ncbi:hypothetical protein L1987_43322 [Smallanthus sonchifolius]|uniref:Uncharacterized protein n=1 Tax=Smallanthus sonchifolius TaxID=185202 RepID=A0ACB9GNC8_9ASTR|nr:hypothetical protein L1987_43322 [Smallanthus sonchifolius]
MRNQVDIEVQMERIRRMQSVFNREKSKQKRSYESWKENNAGGYHQHFQRRIGIGKPKHHKGIEVILRNLLDPLLIIHCHITMQSWVSAGQEQSRTSMMRLRLHSGARQSNFTLIRIQTIKRLLGGHDIL